MKTRKEEHKELAENRDYDQSGELRENEEIWSRGIVKYKDNGQNILTMENAEKNEEEDKY